MAALSSYINEISAKVTARLKRAYRGEKFRSTSALVVTSRREEAKECKPLPRVGKSQVSEDKSVLQDTSTNRGMIEGKVMSRQALMAVLV